MVKAHLLFARSASVQKLAVVGLTGLPTAHPQVGAVHSHLAPQ